MFADISHVLRGAKVVRCTSQVSQPELHSRNVLRLISCPAHQLFASEADRPAAGFHRRVRQLRHACLPLHVRSVYRKVKPVLNGNPSQNCGVSLAIWDHKRHKRAHPALIPASKACTWFTYPGGMEGWVWPMWLVSGYIPRWFTRPQTVTHRSINRARRGVTTEIETNVLHGATVVKPTQPNVSLNPTQPSPSFGVYDAKEHSSAARMTVIWDFWGHLTLDGTHHSTQKLVLKEDIKGSNMFLN